MKEKNHEGFWDYFYYEGIYVFAQTKELLKIFFGWQIHRKIFVGEQLSSRDQRAWERHKERRYFSCWSNLWNQEQESRYFDASWTTIQVWDMKEWMEILCALPYKFDTIFLDKLVFILPH